MSKLVNLLKALSPWNLGSGRTTARQRRLYRPHLEALEDRQLLAATLTFTARGDGTSWEDPKNWTGEQLPGHSDTAIINGKDVTVNNGNAAVFKVLNGGRLTINGSLWGFFVSSPEPSVIDDFSVVTLNSGRLSVQVVELTGFFVWNGGSVDSTRFVNRSEMHLRSSEAMSPGPIENFGTIIHTGAGYLGGGPLTNQAGALYDLRSDGDVSQSTFRNSGTLRKSGGAGASVVSTINNENGRVEVQSGTLVLDGHIATGGHFVVDQGAELRLASGYFTGTYTGEGAGQVRLAPLGSLGIDNATFDFPPNLLHWTGGTIGIGVNGPWRNVGHMTLSGADDKLLGASFNALENSGHIVHKDTGDLRLNGGLRNSGTYQLQSDADITSLGGGGIANTGIFEKCEGSLLGDDATDVNLLFLNQAGGQFRIHRGSVFVGEFFNDGLVFLAEHSVLGSVLGAPSRYEQGANGQLEVQLNRSDGTNSFGRMTIDGPISLAGQLILDEIAPCFGAFLIIRSLDRVFGTFDGLPERAVYVTEAGTRYQISYLSIAVTLANLGRPPTADAGGPYEIFEGDNLELDASASFDPDGNTLSYSWDLNDDGIFDDALSANPTLQWVDDLNRLGINRGPTFYAVSVRVSDGSTEVVSELTSLRVHNLEPVVSAGEAQTILQGDTFTRSGSFNDPGADDWTAFVDYGDGSGQQPLVLQEKTFALSHTYNIAGTFTVDVFVEDGHGGGTASFKVTVLEGTPPTVVDFFARRHRQRITHLLVTFSEPMNVASVQSLGSYELVRAGRDGRLGTADDRTVLLRSARYDPDERIVTIVPRGNVRDDELLRFTIRAGSVYDLASNPLDGDGDGEPGGDYVHTLFPRRRGGRATPRWKRT